MSQLPLATRLLMLWLAAVCLAPAGVGLAQAVGLTAPGMLALALLGAALGAALGLLIFEPPRSNSPRAWLAQLRARLVPTPPSSSQSPNQEH